MEIKRSDWEKYIKKLAGIDHQAASLMKDYIERFGFGNMKSLTNYAAVLVQMYGDASAALSAEMYDAVAAAQKKILPPAKPAETASYGEVARTINGIHKSSENPDAYGSAVGRLVKRQGADTMLLNAERDAKAGAEFAWVPNGDTCAFCITLASRGWQHMSKTALDGGHAEHIHSNCDCTYAIRFDGKSSIEGYDPEQYRQQYYGAEGDTPQERINYMRRQQYAENKDYINAQKRVAYFRRKVLVNREENDIIDKGIDFFAGPGKKKIVPAKYEKYIGDNKYAALMAEADGEEVKKYIRTAYRKTSIIGDGGTVDIRRCELETGLKLGRNGGDHQKKVEQLINLINHVINKPMSPHDKAYLLSELRKLEEIV